MNYYIRTKKEFEYKLSEPFTTKEEAESKLDKIKLKGKEAIIIAIPEFRDGLNLYKNGKYYSTIIGESNELWFIQRYDSSEKEIANPILKEHLLNWFVKGYLDEGIEDYNNDLEFKDVKDLGNDYEYLNIKESEDD